MEQHETNGTIRSGDILDTIALGSMLVFASVMPPLGADSTEVDARHARRRGDRACGGGSTGQTSGHPAVRRARRRFDS